MNKDNLNKLNSYVKVYKVKRDCNSLEDLINNELINNLEFTVGSVESVSAQPTDPFVNVIVAYKRFELRLNYDIRDDLYQNNISNRDENFTVNPTDTNKMIL
ncbi:hypothetical protein D3C81_846540 [compost metagenome]